MSLTTTLNNFNATHCYLLGIEKKSEYFSFPRKILEKDETVLFDYSKNKSIFKNIYNEALSWQDSNSDEKIVEIFEKYKPFLKKTLVGSALISNDFLSSTYMFRGLWYGIDSDLTIGCLALLTRNVIDRYFSSEPLFLKMKKKSNSEVISTLIREVLNFSLGHAFTCLHHTFSIKKCLIVAIPIWSAHIFAYVEDPFSILGEQMFHQLTKIFKDEVAHPLHQDSFSKPKSQF